MPCRTWALWATLTTLVASPVHAQDRLCLAGPDAKIAGLIPLIRATDDLRTAQLAQQTEESLWTLACSHPKFTLVESNPARRPIRNEQPLPVHVFINGRVETSPESWQVDLRAISVATGDVILSDSTRADQSIGQNGAISELTGRFIRELGGRLDSVAPAESVTVDDVAHMGPNHGPLALALLGIWAAAVIAPPAMLFFGVTEPDTIHVTGTDTTVVGSLVPLYLTAFLTGGGMTGMGDDDRTGSTNSGNLELRRGPLYGSLRLQNFHLSGHVQFRTVQLGYLLSPKRHLAGGVTIGYRNAAGHEVHDAVEIALPLIMGNRRGAFHLEPIYVFSRQGVAWDYRLQMEIYILKPVLIGFLFEAKTLRQGEDALGTMGLMLGLRW